MGTTATTNTHLNHRVRWTYDDQGEGTPHCLECDVPVPAVVRTCPQCGATFDGTSIGATPQARILCSDCTWARVQAAGKRRARRGR